MSQKCGPKLKNMELHENICHWVLSHRETELAIPTQDIVEALFIDYTFHNGDASKLKNCLNDFLKRSKLKYMYSYA